MATDTAKLNDRDLCEFLLAGLQSGRFRVEKETDSDGNLTGVHFVSAERPRPAEGRAVDPRRTKPL